MTTGAPIGGIKKKLNMKDFMFNQLDGQNVCKKPGEVNGLEFRIRYLTKCTAAIYDNTAQVSITRHMKFKL
jgi:hypothetical protein